MSDAPAVVKSCNWAQDGYEPDLWDSDCGQSFYLKEGTPLENKMRFCFGCGKPLTESPCTFSEDEDDDNDEE